MSLTVHRQEATVAAHDRISALELNHIEAIKLLGALKVYFQKSSNATDFTPGQRSWLIAEKGPKPQKTHPHASLAPESVVRRLLQE